MESLQNIINLLHLNYWMAEVILVVLVAILANKVSVRILSKLDTKFRKTKNVWDRSLVKAIKNPLYFLIYILAISSSVEIIYAEFDITLLTLVSSGRDVAIIILMGWFLTRFIKEVQQRVIKKREKEDINISRTAIDGITNVSLVFVVVSIVLVTLQTLGFQIGGVLALGGVGGVAIGFAAKDLLSNFFGGLMIYLDRPFKVGDWIRSPDKEIEGTVIKIGWRQTQILTFSKRPLYIPNSAFSTITVENPSRMTNRRIYETIGVRYCDISKVKKIVDEVRDMLQNSELIDQNQTIIVNVDKFAASSIDFFIYTFTRTTDWIEFHHIKEKVLLDIAHIIEENKAEIAFPTSNVNLTALPDNKSPSPLDSLLQ